ncbi:MAG: hypothetical protein ACOX0F_08310 [Syntrophomonadaceae bacterium]|jgi:cell division protein FtsL
MVQAGYKYADSWEATVPRQESPRVRRVRKTYRKVSIGKLLFKVGMAAFAYGLVLVFLCLKASTLGYQIVQLETDIHQLESSNQRLQYEIEKKVSLDYVEQYALTQLGMDKAQEHIKIASAGVTPADTAAGASAPVSVSQKEEPTLHKIYASLVQLAAHNQ